MSEDKSQKTEKATAQRRRQARQEGNIPRTQDLSAWLGVISFLVIGPFSVQFLREAFLDLVALFDDIMRRPDPALYGDILRVALIGILKASAPMLLAAMFLGTLGHVVQGGISVSSKRFKPQWKKLNAFAGLKNMFGAHAAWTLGKTLIKFVVFGLIAYKVLMDTVPAVVGSGAWQMTDLVRVATSTSFDLVRMVAFTGLVIAAADYVMEHRRVDKSLRMTKDEVRRENKQSEGDPHVKGAIRARQRAMGRRRMMAAVADSSVVMVNPTHVAVALTYTPGQGAPQVVAKGTGFLATRIRDEAEAHGVPVIRDVIVARTLYKLCEVGQFIPGELYDAIAQVLAFVFRLDQRGAAGGTHDTPLKHDIDPDNLPDDLSDAAIMTRSRR